MCFARPLLLSAFLASIVPFSMACGKKGPPLAPLRPAPAAVTELTATRLGDTVQLQFTLPTANQDGSGPADLGYVDVFAVTGTPEGPLGRTLTIREIETMLTRVASIEVQPPPVADEGEGTAAAPAAAGGAAPAPVDPRPVQGAVVRAEEVLTDALRTPIFEHPDTARLAKLRAVAGDLIDDEPVPSTEGTGRTLLWPQPVDELARSYIVVPYSTRAVAGPPSAPLAVPFVPAPPAPIAASTLRRRRHSKASSRRSPCSTRSSWSRRWTNR